MEGLCNPHMINDPWQQAKDRKKREASRPTAKTHRAPEKCTPRLVRWATLSGDDRVDHGCATRMNCQPEDIDLDFDQEIDWR